MLSQGCVSAQAVPRQPSGHPRQPSLHPFRRPVRLEYRHLLEAHIVGWCHWSRIQVTTIATDITVLRLHHVRSWRRRHASSLCHDVSCLSPRHVHLVSKVSGRPLGDFIKCFLLTLIIFTLCLPCILEI